MDNGGLTPFFCSHNFGTNNLNQLTNITPNPIPVQGSTSSQASVYVNGQGVTEDANNNFNTTVASAGGTRTPLSIQAVASNGTQATQTNHMLNTQPYTYDANGSLSSDNIKTYTWDAANRLVGVSIIGPVPTTQANNIQMSYDGSNRRVGLTELHGTTVLRAIYLLWCGESLSQERQGNSVTKRFFSLGEQINGTNYYWAIDQLFSVREMTDSSGNIHASYDYDPWGRQIKYSGDVDSDFGYSRFYLNKVSGLDLTHYRAYDDNEGRWLSRDPLAEKVGLNLYSYVKDDPIIKTDPLGLATACGFEGNCFAGYGLTTVICCDANHVKHKMTFKKWCGGLAVGFSASAFNVFGMDGSKCDPKNYEGWFLELGYGDGAGGSVDIGFDNSCKRTGVSEFGGGCGVGSPGKISLCYYQLVSNIPIGKCCP